ncbi:CaiB/BaiF CoA-transferase family protein [Acidisphaera sp. L21]|uniref:CaiB/BaiF CoA transferase family protein n=1 Tax=Acidisphaera sp. L21 TaxID=1641851 RepID=UPI00131C0039|nr:CoA transferase [Acidisphaera sp. L21]
MKPLAGVKILDFSRVLAGPFATQILAELGADVTKVERPRTGDESRSFEPQLPHGQSAYFFALNRAKKSITLNLKSTAGQDIARRLVAQADVVVENFLPGEMAKYKLDYASLSADNPRMIYVSNTGFGQTGPYRNRNGYDTVFQALSGVMDLTGYPDAPPAKVGLPFADLTSGLYIAISILTGLVGRNASGRGCYVDLAMMDVQTSLLSIAAARLFALDEDPQRVGTEHMGRVPSAAFQCRDGGWLHISGSDQHWQKICRVLELAEMADDLALAENAARVTRRDEIMATLRAAIAQRDRTPLAEALRAQGVPAGEVNTVRDILNDPHILARGMIAGFDHPTEGKFAALRNPLRFDGFDNPITGTPPLLGADTDDVLHNDLGMDSAAIAGLRAERVI